MKSQLPALMIPKGRPARSDGDSGVDANASASPDHAAVDGASVSSILTASACFEPRRYEVAPRVRSKKKRFG